MEQNAKISEQLKLLGTIGPGAAAADEYASDWFDMADYQRLLVVVSVGDVVATLTASLEQNTQANLDDSPDVAGKAIASKSVSFSASNDNKQKMINVRGNELDKANSYQHVRVVVANVDSPPGVVGLHVAVWGLPKQQVAAGHHTNVTEVV